MVAAPVMITKADGTQEPFRIEKLIESLARAGASKAVSEKIAERVAENIANAETTSSIYRRAFKELRKEEKPLAARYSIRRALLEFGPSGFPFERFVAEIFAAQGFDTSVGLSLGGKCAVHEVDVLAIKKDGVDERCIAIEAKFHQKYGFKSDLKVALYVHARIQDLIGAEVAGERHHTVNEGLLITNTKFTDNAREYADCAKLPVISWNYPHEGSLEQLIESTGVYPVTVLTSLSKAEKRQLIGEQVTLCRSLPGREQVLEAIGVPKKRIQSALEESAQLCKEEAHLIQSGH